MTATPLLEDEATGEAARPPAERAADPQDAADGKKEPAEGQEGAGDWKTLAFRPVVFFSCLNIFAVLATLFLPTPFFPDSPAGRLIGSTWVGVALAAYGFGEMFVNFLSPKIIAAIGSKKACHIGAASFLCLLLLFGLLPKLLHTRHSLGLGLAATRFFCGIGGGLMQTTMVILMNNAGQQMGQVSLVTALQETAAGVGGVAGSFLGGAIYVLGVKLGAMDPFFFPFLVGAVLAAICYACFVLNVVSEHTEAASQEEEGGASLKGVLEVFQRNTISMIAFFASCAFMMILGPILEPGLKRRYHFSELDVGDVFAFQGLSYIVFLAPLASRVDELLNGKSVCMGRFNMKALQAMALFVTSLGFLLMGPLSDLIVSRRWLSVLAFYLGIAGTSFGNSIFTLTSLPELQLGVDTEDNHALGMVAGAWAGMFSAGAAVGPAVGGAFYDVTKDFNLTFVILSVIAVVLGLLQGSSALANKALIGTESYVTVKASEGEAP